MTLGRGRAGLAAFLVLATAGSLGAQERSAYQELQTFSGVLHHIRSNHADTVGYRRMIRSAIEGILEDLDPHSYFLSREDGLVLGRLEDGELGGVGIELEPLGGQLVVRTLHRGGPAEAAGVFPGDRVVAIDDTSVAGLEAPQVAAKLAGPKGTEVRLRLSRGPLLQPREFEIMIRRQVLDVSAVDPPLLIDSAAAFVRLKRFGDETARDLERVLDEVEDADRLQVILDLRGNPGGLVSEAVGVASLFLPGGSPVFSTRGRKRDVNVDYVTDERGKFRNLQLVLLIDEGSASAAEALAGALQDLDRALIVGRRSFGKALVQAPFFLPDRDVVFLTIGRVHTPSGRVIQRPYRGLTADQYRSFAGSAGAAADTLPLHRTAGGRPVRGGGGIAPDLETDGPPPPPAWWSAARERGWVEELADRAAANLPADDDAVEVWAADEAAHLALADSLAARATEDLELKAGPTPDVRAWMGRTIAGRVAAIRWGVDTEARFRLLTDPDIAAARKVFADWHRLLAGAGPPDVPK